jgi:hypothetical protein
MGVAIPSIVGAVLLAVDSSSQDRRQVQAQRLLTSWSETIANGNSDLTYSVGSCPAPAYYQSGAFAPSGLPAGFHASVVSLKYWKAGAFDPSACSTEEGVRLIRIRISVDAALYPSFALDRDVVVRKPCVAC